MTLYYAMSAGQHANGAIVKANAVDPQVQYLATCSSTGGTGPIIGGTGDRTCASAGTTPSWRTTYLSAEAYVYNSAGSIIAAGATTKVVIISQEV